MSSSAGVISVEHRGRVAVITIANEKKLNALTQAQYYELSQALREVARRDEVFVTVLLGRGRFFSAQRGADVSVVRTSPSDPEEARKQWLQTFLAFNLNITEAFASHPKILVVGLNGPVVGLTAAVISHADFIYCAPHAFLLTPFSSLGLVAEGGSSRALVTRLGPARANEALIMSKRITSAELERCGFVNSIFHGVGQGEDEKFRQMVLDEVDERLGEHLVGDSLVGIKKLIRGPEQNLVRLSNFNEVFAGLERLVTGVPQEEFRKIASGEKRHKL
ncbi:enoyl-CoA hydratase/isomerase [Trichoderma cornu-damae]|uniref:Enoyl-CoA hydratase/isomerase n=1 Tax=Trichoderma cornu-damae TaxID=654480 RepID=A0A9P8TUK1_9HYPO|nr:enoyl-CoA hydratase/isomerase [Trichoderma cornu-damae]